MRRVVVTGMGIVSPVGTGVEYAWKNVVAGNSGVDMITSFDVTDINSKFAGQPKIGTGEGECHFDSVVEPKEQRRMDRVSLYALVAADQAIKDSGIMDANIDFERAGVSIGSGIGGMEGLYEGCKAAVEGGARRVSPFFIPIIIANMPAGHVSIKYGFKGPNMAISTACATGSHSIGEGMRLIKHGDADIMVVGGAEASVTFIGQAAFAAMRALSTRNDNPKAASRPWDIDRDGFVMGEGSAVLILEEYEHAKKRGAKIYAEVAGYGLSGDASHITAPAEGGEGGKRAMMAAMKDAGMTAKDIDYINAHGTSTPLGDVGELAAVRSLFDGTGASMSSTKSTTGHMLGAAGAAEALFTIMALRDQVAPPTINLENPVPEAEGFDLVPNKAKPREIRAALSNSFGFGGTNASLVFKKVD